MEDVGWLLVGRQPVGLELLSPGMGQGGYLEPDPQRVAAPQGGAIRVSVL
jgi:hypothetical protein